MVVQVRSKLSSIHALGRESAQLKHIVEAVSGQAGALPLPSTLHAKSRVTRASLVNDLDETLLQHALSLTLRLHIV
jgi:hypothetical protein